MEKKENAEIMNDIANCRKDEFRRLTKQTKDKNELDRMKREITTRLVEMGVQEREKIAKTYGKHRKELEDKHTEIILQLKQEKDQVSPRAQSACYFLLSIESLWCRPVAVITCSTSIRFIEYNVMLPRFSHCRYLLFETQPKNTVIKILFFDFIL